MVPVVYETAGAIVAPPSNKKETMPKNTSTLVREFHEIFRAAIGDDPSIETGFEELRFRLIREEVAETLFAIMSSDEVEFADGLGDIDYVVEGAAITFGINLLDSFDHALASHRKFKYYELLGLLVLGVRHLGEYLNDPDRDTSEFAIAMIQAILTNIKANIWTIAEQGDIPLGEVVAAIHESNMTKLGEDGKPIFNEYQKVIKGPNYVPPTVKIKEILDAKKGNSLS